MGKNRSASGLTNIIQYDNSGNITFVSGSTTLMSVSSSGAITTTGTISGSDATNALLLNGTGSLAFTTTASYNVASASLSSRTTQVEKTYASTGSNTFTGAQFVSDTSNAISFTSTASLYSDGGLRVQGNSFVSGTAYFNNIVVYGTSSVQYITSSQVNVGTNIITVNTDTPAVRFGGLAVFDSGSTQLTGSILWDSEKNHWVYSNPSGSSYSGGMLISGPRSSALGSEQGTTSCMLLVGQGGDHLTSSLIYHDTTCTSFYSNTLFVTSSERVGIGVCNIRDTFVVGLNGGAVLERFTGTNPYSGDLYFYSARGTSSSPTTKCNGDVAMGIRPRAYDGTSYLDVAAIESKIDGGVSSNSMCGNLIFSTNGGTTTLTERMRITSCGKIGIGSNNPTYLLDIAAGTNGNFSTPAVRISTSTGGAGGATILQINHTANSVSGLQIAEYGAAPGNYASIINTENSYMIFGTNNTERMKIECDGVAELKQYWKIGTGINSTCYLVVSENQIYRTGCGILYINNSATGQVSIASGGGVLTLGTNDQQSGYFLTTKNQGITNANTYFGTGTVRIGGGSDHGGSTVLSVAPGVVTFDRPGVGGGALTINSSGYVTLPSQPSFLAASTAGQQDYTSGQVIVFNTTRHNTGSHYNTSTGRFTAPVAGRYLLSVNFYTYTNIRASITLTVNGNQYTPQDLVPLLYHEDNVGSASSGFTLIFELSANDYVEVRSRAGYTSRVYMSHSHFAGQLLS